MTKTIGSSVLTLTLIRLTFLRVIFSGRGVGEGGVSLTSPSSSYFKENLSNINVTLYNY